jgi:hypothetical protein
LEKHTAYYNLLEQLKDSACPICSQAEKSVQKFLDSYLYEGVNDDRNWNRLSAAGGWCSRHARQLEGFSDGLAVALFYRHEIRKRIQSLGERKETGWFSKKSSIPPCPACIYQDEIEAGQAHLLVQSLGEEEFQTVFRNHPGLCLPHTTAVLGNLRGDEALRYQKSASEKLEALCVELDEIVSKSDYRASDKMGSSGDAWKRALARVYGPNYDY